MVMTKLEALKVLEIGQGSTPEEVRSSYKKLALKWHPDKHNNSTESTKKFQEISEAYKRLTSKDDDDDITISMADMFDLFAHIFFSNNRRYFVNEHMFYSDDDDDDDYYNIMNASDSSDDDVRVYRTRQHHGKYSDLMASRVSKAAAASYKNAEMRKKKAQVRTGVSEAEAMKNAEELIKEEEKLKKKAEKRRARKKRHRANRKQREKEQKTDGQEAENDDVSDENDASEEETAHSRERRDSSKENKNPTVEKNTRINGNKNNNKKSTLEKSGEEDDSDNEHAHDETWDTSSAFFNHAARRGPVNTTNHNANHESTTATAETFVNNNEHNSSTQATRGDRPTTAEAEVDPLIVQSRHLAACGNNEANEGNYVEAIGYFTQAISFHNRDFRFFGNRSYCYDRLGDYSKALQDAEVTILLVPNWAKGYFRKGRALAGLQQYADAEKAFLQVLKLDKHCEDAKFELTRVRVQQLKDMGFEHAPSERAIRLYGTVHAALDALLSGKVKNLVTNEDEMYVSDGEVDEQDNDPRQRYGDPMATLWVGNVDPKQVTERQLTQLFSKFGKITLIRILPQSFCAFVNYENKESAARALQSLQGYTIGGQIIRLRYPSGEKYSKAVGVQEQQKGAKPTGPVNGNECYFWRTTGCAYGDKCHYIHMAGNKGIDIDKVEQKYGKLKPMRKGR